MFLNINSILTSRLDDKLTDFILNKFYFFKYIHPNIITLSGMISNFFILFFILNKFFISSVLLLVYRYLADCLDGGVARKYNKKSKLGGALDTWSDTILVYILIIGIFNVYNFSFGSEFAAFIACFNLYIMSLSNSLVDHVGMKSGNGLFSKTYAFLVNNSFILFFLCIIVLYFS
jgi:phosphatidylglycerophosphate synthase